MLDYIEVNKELYDNLAEEYKKRRENKSPFEESAEYLGNCVLKHVKKEVGRSINVVEIGPGAGQLLHYFEKNGCRTIGIELSEKMAKIAKEYSPNSIIINSDTQKVDLLEEQFHLVYMGAIIHLMPKSDADKLLKKVWSWLENDGIIFINTTCNNASIEGFFEKKDYGISKIRYRRYWTENDFELFVKSSGFSLIEKLYTNECDREKKWVALICKKEGFA